MVSLIILGERQVSTAGKRCHGAIVPKAKARGGFMSRPAKTAAHLFRIETGGTIEGLFRKVLWKRDFSTTPHMDVAVPNES